MISSIEIKNFRGIQDGKLENLTPLTILVGPNGSGKSAILEALLIGANDDPVTAFQEVCERRSLEDKVRWLIWQGEYYNGVTIKVTSNSLSWRKCDFYSHPLKRGTDEELQSTTTSAKSDGVDIQFGSEDWFNPKKSGFTGIGLIDPSAFDLSPLVKIRTKIVEKGNMAEVISLISSVIPGLSDLELGVSEEGSPLIYLDFKTYAIPLGTAGDGVQSLVRICMELAVLKDGVALMEEPEVHKHPAAINQTAKAIFAAVRRGVQVAMTTHSLELIDALIREAKDEEGINLLSVFGL